MFWNKAFANSMLVWRPVKWSNTTIFRLIENPQIWRPKKCCTYLGLSQDFTNFLTGETKDMPNITWLVVSTPLKNISQWEGLSQILWKIKNVPNHQPVTIWMVPHETLIPSRHASAFASWPAQGILFRSKSLRFGLACHPAGWAIPQFFVPKFVSFSWLQWISLVWHLSHQWRPSKLLNNRVWRPPVS